MCFSPHESAAVLPRQMPSTLSLFCPPKTADTPSHSSTPHKKAPVSPPHSGWNSQTDLFRHFFSSSFPQHKPNQIAPTAADLIHSDLTEIPVWPTTPPSAGSTVQTNSWACGSTYVCPWNSRSSRSSVSAVLTIRTLKAQVQPVLKRWFGSKISDVKGRIEVHSLALHLQWNLLLCRPEHP